MSPLIRNARLLERHKDDIDRHTQHDANSSAISQGGPESNIGQRQVLVKSEYEPRTGVYQTNQLDIVSGIKRITTRHRQQSSDADHEQAADGFRDYITHSLTAIITRSSGPFDRIDYLIAGLFYLNVFMSILNTVLLSFLVKSVQLSGHNLLSNHGGGIGGGAGLGLFTWDEHSESMHLDLPARLRSDKFLSVGTIESNQDKPLIIENVNTPTGHGDGANGFVNDGASPESSAWPSSLDKSMEGGQILISAKPRPLSTDSGLLSAATETANYILIPSARPSSTPLPPPQQPGGSFNGRAEQEKQQEQQQQQQQKLLHSQPVEMVTSSLILSQLNDEERHVTSKDSRNGAGGSSQMSYAVHHHVPLASGTRSDQLKRQTMGGVMHASSNSRSRRVLELDGKRQTIVLPLLNKIDLFPSGSSSLFVNNELKCNSGISGRLDDNFDIQTRWGNLSFQSGRTLRIVSRSDKLNLASTRLLTLDAPTLRFSVPQTNKMLISNGIEFLEMDQQRQQPKQLRLLEEKRGDRRVDDGEQLSGHLPISTVASASLPLPLEAFKLVLIDDILMAAQD